MISRRRNFCMALAIIVYISTESEAFWKDYELGTIIDMNGTGSPVEFNLQPKRVNRNTYGITGKVTINDDFKNYEAEVKLYVSTKGNDQYVLSPMKIPRGPLCGKANDEYRKFLMEELSKTSDLPNSDAADICPLFEKKTYNVKDYQFAANKVPSFLQAGWYRIHILIYDKSGTLVSGIDAGAHFY